jgi:YD repeat-containing protein
LTELTFKTSAGVVTKKIACTYDAFDRLIAKQVDATGDGTTNWPSGTCTKATGTSSIVNHLDYNAYGQITAQTDPQNSSQASTDEIHYAYTGREWDADVGLGVYS